MTRLIIAGFLVGDNQEAKKMKKGCHLRDNLSNRGDRI